MDDQVTDLGRPHINLGVTIVIIVLIFVILIVIAIYIRVNTLAEALVKVENLGVNSQYPWGSSVIGKYQFNNGQNLDRNSCINNPNSDWEDPFCNCKIPFFGPSCEYQTYVRSYRDVGPIRRRQWNLDLGINQHTKWLSFNPDRDDLGQPGVSEYSCTEFCNLDPDCQGVIWNHTTENCQLLKSIPVVKNQELIQYTTEQLPNQEQLLLKNQERPEFPDRVILEQGSPQWRPWLVMRYSDAVYSIQTIFPMRLVNIDWLPQRIMNDGKMIGIYANSPFGNGNPPNGVQGVDWVILYPGDNPSIIPEWGNYYIIYYPVSQLPGFVN